MIEKLGGREEVVAILIRGNKKIRIEKKINLIKRITLLVRRFLNEKK